MERQEFKRKEYKYNHHHRKDAFFFNQHWAYFKYSNHSAMYKIALFIAVVAADIFLLLSFTKIKSIIYSIQCFNKPFVLHFLFSTISMIL